MFVENATPEELETQALVEYIKATGDRLAQLNSGVEEEETELIIPRSPSPPPEYDREGRRTNTRILRKVKQVEIERSLAVNRALELIPGYIPPSNFTKLTRSVEKYYLPVNDYPQINFMGLLLGPRGKNLRRMETEAGAKISIRGRGSIKEGLRKANERMEDDLHCVVSSTSQQSVSKAIELIKEVVDNSVQTPEHMNDFKRLQLRELARLNGTLRDYENQPDGLCKTRDHRNQVDDTGPNLGTEGRSLLNPVDGFVEPLPGQNGAALATTFNPEHNTKSEIPADPIATNSSDAKPVASPDSKVWPDISETMNKIPTKAIPGLSVPGLTEDMQIAAPILQTAPPPQWTS